MADSEYELGELRRENERLRSRLEDERDARRTEEEGLRESAFNLEERVEVLETHLVELEQQLKDAKAVIASVSVNAARQAAIVAELIEKVAALERENERRGP